RHVDTERPLHFPCQYLIDFLARGGIPFDANDYGARHSLGKGHRPFFPIRESCTFGRLGYYLSQRTRVGDIGRIKPRAYEVGRKHGIGISRDREGAALFMHVNHNKPIIDKTSADVWNMWFEEELC